MYMRLTVSAIVADPPRLSLTVMVPGFVSLRIPALGDTAKLLRKEPSFCSARSVNVPISLPVEVTYAVKVAPALASNPEIWRYLFTVLGAHTAYARWGRSEVPVPIVMVSCWVPDGPADWPRLLGCGAICTVKGYVPA